MTITSNHAVGDSIRPRFEIRSKYLRSDLSAIDFNRAKRDEVPLWSEEFEVIGSITADGQEGFTEYKLDHLRKILKGLPRCRNAR